MSNAPSPPAGITIHREPSDDAARRLLERAFGAEGPAIVGLVDDLEASAHHRDLAFVARSDSAAVGYVLLTRAWVDAAPRLVDVLVLGPLAVAPEAQGRGVGTALIEGALAAADADGWPLVFLEGAPGYYGPRGFRRADALGFTSPSARIPPEAFQVAVLRADEGWMRGALVYTDPFWLHDVVGLRDGNT